ncbi:hypothetical protein MOK15_04175 [Sphingobium sp. BYY-5]|uniref:hypothetical protein n=1 Tax=Sphingobium sp. BYY-5 TaxID=2926400 RepID=UPI001FA7943B|nr:hypothetical protein [Sphingobium sp. BYY-5]MCI4589297.1 hypothetical protein [Sphingobium sp. BYY-5]
MSMIAQPFFLAILLLSGMGSVLYVYVDVRAGDLFSNIGVFVAGAVLNYLAVRAVSGDDSLTPRLTGLFGLSILSGLATLLGLLLLILPGLFLYLRWFMAWPIFVGERTNIIEAMKISWQRMKGWEVAAGLPVGALLLLFLAGLIGLDYFGHAPDRPSGLIDAFIGNAFMNALILLTYVVSVASYACVARETADLTTGA